MSHEERARIPMSIISTALRGIHDGISQRDEAVAQWQRWHAHKHFSRVTSEGLAAVGSGESHFGPMESRRPRTVRGRRLRIQACRAGEVSGAPIDG
jgi:hypothetical protein